MCSEVARRKADTYLQVSYQALPRTACECRRFVPNEKRISRIRTRAPPHMLSVPWLCWYLALRQSHARICLPGAAIRSGNGKRTLGDGLTLALVACCREAGLHPFRDTNAFLLRNCGHDSNHGVAEDAAGVEILLGETAVADAVTGESLQVLQRGRNAFPREPVKRPEQQTSSCRRLPSSNIC
jgi:hypothetical protein